MTENEIATELVDAALVVHRTLGSGPLESAYESALAFELERRSLATRRQVPIDIDYFELRIEGAFRADLVVEEKVLVELKALSTVGPIHKRQVITYLRLSGLKLGFLIDFGATRLKDGLTRIANGRL